MIKCLLASAMGMISLISCNEIATTQNVVSHERVLQEAEKNEYKALFEKNKDYVASGFDFPVGKPDGKGYYNAQKFGENNHLGDDWNGLGGGNSDKGDTISAIANGYVVFAEDIGGGWGNVIRIIHQYEGALYESIYAHCDTIVVTQASWVEKGATLGTIGTANGQYYAHLHLEIRDDITMPIGGGYSEDTQGYVDPTLFIKEH